MTEIQHKVNLYKSIEPLASKYDVSAHEMFRTVLCESEGFHHQVIGDGGKAYGIAQFHRPTFDWFKQMAVEDGYPFDTFSYDNRNDQLELMAWAFAEGLQNHWTCWTKHFAT